MKDDIQECDIQEDEVREDEEDVSSFSYYISLFITLMIVAGIFYLLYIAFNNFFPEFASTPFGKFISEILNPEKIL